MSRRSNSGQGQVGLTKLHNRSTRSPVLLRESERARVAFAWSGYRQTFCLRSHRCNMEPKRVRRKVASDSFPTARTSMPAEKKPLERPFRFSARIFPSAQAFREAGQEFPRMAGSRPQARDKKSWVAVVAHAGIGRQFRGHRNGAEVPDRKSEGI